MGEKIIRNQIIVSVQKKKKTNKQTKADYQNQRRHLRYIHTHR